MISSNISEMKEFLESSGFSVSYSKSMNMENISFICRDKKYIILNVVPQKKKIFFWGKSKSSGMFFDYIKPINNGFNLYKKIFFFKILVGFVKFQKG